MTVLLLRLAAPLQSWGTGSRFVRRNTDRVPSRSGVIGLLAAAQGRRRTDPIEDLLGLRIGVRVEQPGRLERDFQTARTRDGATSMPLSYRFYLADAAFLAAIEGPTDMLAGLRDALLRPAFPLFLGRRSCPPAGRLVLGLRDADVESVLTDEPWQASPFVRKAHRNATITLDTVVDSQPRTVGGDLARDDPISLDLVRDDPISFDPRHRQYDWRAVLHGSVTVPNPEYRATAVASSPGRHEPMDALGGVG